ncbi:MAG: hypothetical protein ABSG36_19630 [Acidimicrobiales bacterium]|jgi:hypothetical protein
MLAVLARLLERGRYQDLQDGLDGISYKELTETLRRADVTGSPLGVSIPGPGPGREPICTPLLLSGGPSMHRSE